MAEALYTIDILRLAAATGNWPRLDAPNGTSERRSLTCGSRIAVDVAVDGSGRVTALGMEVNACALGQASAAILAGAAPGQDEATILGARACLAAYLSGADETLPDWPGMIHLARARAYSARHPSILLAFDALSAALDAANTQCQAGAVG